LGTARLCQCADIEVRFFHISISQNKITAAKINSTGEWLAFGSSRLGQLLVWEWQSESYVLKQQGHESDMTCIDYSPDGQIIATGGDDGKIKVWSTQSGFCYVTFTEHSGSVKSLQFSRKKQIVFSASIDGTVRAFDLIRYRNFRTFTSPTPEQFNCLAVDASTEIVCAASSDNFDIYMWSIQTGQLLEIISGHEAPISCMSFSPATGQLVSGSWDQTVRVWDIFSRSKGSETFEHRTEVLALAISPDSSVIASTTLDGCINFWSLDNGSNISTIEGRSDILGGRSSKDKMSLDKSSSGKSFNSVCFSSDGRAVLAGGNSRYVCLYDISSKSLLKRFSISSNLSLDRMQEQLNSKNMTEGGPKDLIDETAEESDLEDRLDRSLPGVQNGDPSLRSTRPEARTNALKFSPTGRSWASASTEGLLIYSVDDNLHFDPFDLDMEITPDLISKSISRKEFSKAIIASFRLGEIPIIDRVYNSIPKEEIDLIVRNFGSKYYEKFLKLLVRQLDTNPRLEFHIEWAVSFLKSKSHFLQQNSQQFIPILRALRKNLSTIQKDIGSM
jgi:periodic tryptophan protein 2